MAKRKSVQTKKRKKRVSFSEAAIFVQSTFNNTIISLGDVNGNTIAWASAGTAGFKGSKKGTAYAAQLAAEDVGRQALDMGIKKVTIFVKGPGAGREPSVRAIQSTGLEIVAIKDRTPLPHNGCRPKKRRRV